MNDVCDDRNGDAKCSSQLSLADTAQVVDRGVHEKGAFHSASPLPAAELGDVDDAGLGLGSSGRLTTASASSWAESARVRFRRLAWVARVTARRVHHRRV
jgi:hypothetical protein